MIVEPVCVTPFFEFTCELLCLFAKEYRICLLLLMYNTQDQIYIMTVVMCDRHTSICHAECATAYLRQRVAAPYTHRQL